EVARAWIMTGFSWYYLGHTQHAVLPLIQVADLAGAYGVTFLVAAVNAVLFEVLYHRAEFRTFFALPPADARRGAGGLVPFGAAAVGVLLAAALGYGFVRLGQEEFTPGPRVALVQGNLDQRIRNEAAHTADPAETMWNHFQALHRRAAAQEPKPDLIVWPETSFLYPWTEFEPDFPAERLPPGWQRAEQDGREVVGAELPDWRRQL